MKKFPLEKASKAFMGIRSMGLFAPLSYWRSSEDWGVGDADVLSKVIEFAKKVRISVLSMLPLNIPLRDNCPYANASTYVFDPVYIGINMLLADYGFGMYPEVNAFVSSLEDQIADLRSREKSLNDETRELKYSVFRMVFMKFRENELGDEGRNIADFLTASRKKLNSGKGCLHVRRFKAYCTANDWLGDHLLFFILARTFGSDDFRSWPENIAGRSTKAVRELKEEHSEELLFEAFLQWVLTEQLKTLRNSAGHGEFKVDLMLDQPFAFGSADVWCSQDAFILDPQTLKREYTQGAPPHRLDIPQHWQFHILNTDHPDAKELLIRRLSFFLQFCDLLRIDHLLGYYRLYYLTEDTDWNMTLENMGIWDDIREIFRSDVSAGDKREQIYALIKRGVRNKFPPGLVSRVFDESGNLTYAHVILAARKPDKPGEYDRIRCGWYSQSSEEHGGELIYTLLSPNMVGHTDYLEKITEEKEMFLRPSDSIRAGFFNMGPGEEIVSLFMRTAQEKGKNLIFENLGVVPKRILRSLDQLRASQFKPLIFGYQYFADDPNEFWFDRITRDSHVCFSTHDTLTLRGWWEGREKWAEKKCYFTNSEQRQAVRDWLVRKGYLHLRQAQIPSGQAQMLAENDPDVLSRELLRAVLHSVADSEGREAVIMMPNIFASGDKGIINMPGSRGFWTARSPVSVEMLMDAADGELKGGDDIAGNAIHLINFLVRQKGRDDFQKQVRESDPAKPHLMAVHPTMGDDSKQLAIHGEFFLTDAVVYGHCQHASLIFENGRQEKMEELELRNALPRGVKIFRAYIPADEHMIGVFPFQIALDGNLHPEIGYMIGCSRGTDMNPLSENYGKITKT